MYKIKMQNIDRLFNHYYYPEPTSPKEIYSLTPYEKYLIRKYKPIIKNLEELKQGIEVKSQDDYFYILNYIAEITDNKYHVVENDNNEVIVISDYE